MVPEHGPWDDELTSDEGATDEWLAQQEPEWQARREEGLRRYPPGTRIRNEHGDLGVVVLVDSLGDLHIDMEGEGVGICSRERWHLLTAEPVPDERS